MPSSTSGQDDPYRALWLATRAGKMEPSCPRGTTRCIQQAKFPRKPYNKSFIDQVCPVKMAGYWPRSFFASLWTSTPSRFKHTKKNSANIQPSRPLTWSKTHTYFRAKWRLLFLYSPIIKTARVAKKIWRILSAIASIWSENMLAYLSLDIIRSSQLTVFLEFRSRKAVRFLRTDNVRGQICEHIFPPNGDYCLYIP